MEKAAGIWVYPVQRCHGPSVFKAPAEEGLSEPLLGMQRRGCVGELVGSDVLIVPDRAIFASICYLVIVLPLLLRSREKFLCGHVPVRR